MESVAILCTLTTIVRLLLQQLFCLCPSYPRCRFNFINMATQAAHHTHWSILPSGSESLTGPPHSKSGGAPCATNKALILVPQE